ncbi:lycopene cyclase domain-containing protein [Kytococcus sedentarius]|uniref:lycopene cyclase domain-containing protein n=1 Tax=Kytococcus sedentarius TaxID=1276 RepID=UPI0035BC4335
MTYLWVNAAVLAVCLVVAAVCLARVGAPVRRRTVVASGIALAVSCVFTAVFDSLIIGAGIVAYEEAHLAGWRIGLAPVEDFAYTIAAAGVLPALWVALRARGDRA